MQKATALAVAVILVPFSFTPAESQNAFGQTFTVPEHEFLLQSVFTGTLEGPTAGIPYALEIFGFSGGSLIGPAVFSLALTGPVEPNQRIAIHRLLSPLGTYAFTLRTGFMGKFGGLRAHIADDFLSGEAIGCGMGPPGTPPLECDILLPDDDITDFALTFTAPPTTVVPEPGTILLLATGLLGLGVVARHRRHA